MPREFDDFTRSYVELMPAGDGRRRLVRRPSLLTELDAAITGARQSAGDSGGRGNARGIPINLDALDIASRARAALEDTTTTLECMRELWRRARVVLGIDPPAPRIGIACPVVTCGRVQTLEVDRATGAARCTACGVEWPHVLDVAGAALPALLQAA